MNRRIQRSVLAILVGGLLLSGATTQASGEDLLAGIVPFEPAGERNAFLAAAGVDSQISQEEFQRDRKAGKGFARPFDTWAAILAHDADRDKSIAWSEAKNYRLDQKKTLLEGFDADGDLRLRGEERTQALAALRAGRLTPEKDEPQGRDGPEDARPGRKVKPGSALAAYDANGDGLLDPDEVRKAIARVKAQWKQARISRFDTDGDGTLNQEERQAMGQSYRQDASGMQDWALRRFDLDGDGQLNQDEKAVMKEMRQSFQATMKRLADRVMDANGDGEITKLEKASVAMAWSQEGSLLILKAQDWIDADSDAEVTWEEQRDFRRSGMRALRKWFDKFSAPYDQDGDGTFSRGEVRELMQGVDQELDRRLKLADADEDGRLTAREAVSALEDLGREMGVIPSQTPASRPASRSR